MKRNAREPGYYFKSTVCPTFQIQVFSPHGGLRGDLGVDLHCVEVIGVAGDHHIMPVVVVERCVRIAFDEVSAVSQVRNVMQVAVHTEGRKEAQSVQAQRRK